MLRCNNVASEWHYSVEFGGVGNPPEHMTHVGQCSQYAVFRRLQKPEPDEASYASLVYEQVCVVGLAFRFKFSVVSLL